VCFGESRDVRSPVVIRGEPEQLVTPYQQPISPSDVASLGPWRPSVKAGQQKNESEQGDEGTSPRAIRPGQGKPTRATADQAADPEGATSEPATSL
jgi:hypothetical protein